MAKNRYGIEEENPKKKFLKKVSESGGFSAPEEEEEDEGVLNFISKGAKKFLGSLKEEIPPTPKGKPMSKEEKLKRISESFKRGK